MGSVGSVGSMRSPRSALHSAPFAAHYAATCTAEFSTSVRSLLFSPMVCRSVPLKWYAAVRFSLRVSTSRWQFDVPVRFMRNCSFIFPWQGPFFLFSASVVLNALKCGAHCASCAKCGCESCDFTQDQHAEGYREYVLCRTASCVWFWTFWGRI